MLINHDKSNLKIVLNSAFKVEHKLFFDKEIFLKIIRKIEVNR